MFGYYRRYAYIDISSRLKNRFNKFCMYTVNFRLLAESGRAATVDMRMLWLVRKMIEKDKDQHE